MLGYLNKGKFKGEVEGKGTENKISTVGDTSPSFGFTLQGRERSQQKEKRQEEKANVLTVIGVGSSEGT